MPAIIYARVSTAEQAEKGHSLSEQVALCRKLLATFGVPEHDILEFADDAPGELLDRPELGRVRELLRSKNVSHFVCYDPDRLARNLAHQLLLTEEIERAGARLEFVNFEWKNTPEGRLFYALRGAIAEFEKEKIRQRTSMGRRAKAKTGKLPRFVRMFGYLFNEEEDRLEIDESQADTVRLIFRLAAEGMSNSAIARWLMENGIPAADQSHWYRSAVRRIRLRDTYHTGILNLFTEDSNRRSLNKFRPVKERTRGKPLPREEWIQIRVPAIITEEEFRAAQRVPNQNHLGNVAMLAGVASCGLCGAGMQQSVGAHLASGERMRYYACSGRRNRNDKDYADHGAARCSLPYIRMEKLDEAVWREVKRWLATPRAVGNAIRESRRDSVRAVESERVGIVRLLESIAAEESRLFKAYQKGWMNDSQVETSLAEIRTRRDRLQGRLADLDKELASMSAIPRQIAALQRLKESYGDALDSLTREQQRQIVRTLIDKVIVGVDEIVLHAAIPDELVGGDAKGWVTRAAL